MKAEILLAQLRSLFERAPDFDQYALVSRDHAIWLGQAHAWSSILGIKRGDACGDCIARNG